MRSYDYTPNGVCSTKIHFEIDDDGNIHNLQFIGGCNGNLKAISLLVEGKNAKDISKILKGNICGMKNTSCADQLSIAISKLVV